jgi:hypothetical protein
MSQQKFQFFDSGRAMKPEHNGLLRDANASRKGSGLSQPAANKAGAMTHRANYTFKTPYPTMSGFNRRSNKMTKGGSTSIDPFLE